MWIYYLKLAWLSTKRTPVLSMLMVLAIATGVGACLTTLTLYSVIASNPMAHKNDSLFRLQLDSWGADQGVSGPNDVPVNLTFRDAVALFKADQAERTLLMVKAGLTLERPDSDTPPTIEASRITTNSFFPMFDVPFIHGAPWSDSADHNGEQVAVITESMNNRYFGGENSVGEPVLLEDEVFTVVGVVADDWSITPTVYDLNNGGFDGPEQIYIPFFNIERRMYPFWSDRRGWKHEEFNSHADFLASELVWVQTWVLLPSQEQQLALSQFMRTYIQEQKTVGRFERPLKFELSSPEQWLAINKVATRDSQLLVGLSLAFLLVCLVNAAVLLLAKFLRRAPEAGLRRALGARRAGIFAQHLAEAATIGVTGALVGLLLSWLGLAAIRALYSSYQAVAVMSSYTILAALVLAICSSLLSGVLPAWQIALAQPSRYLKTQ